jgi:hypothetical protein
VEYEEIKEAATHLFICMPTDLAALVGLLLCLKKFQLPSAGAHQWWQWLAFEWLRTALSIGEITRRELPMKRGYQSREKCAP